MTQQTVLELAQNGDPQAIATLMNRTLHAQGMNARVARQGDRLMVMTEAEQVPNRMLMTNFVRNGINGLRLNDSVRIVRILGKQKGADQPAWVQEIELSIPDAATALESDGDEEPETAALHADSGAASDRPAKRPVPPPPMGRMQAEPASAQDTPATSEPMATHATPPVPPPPRPVPPPPPPPPSMGSLDDDDDSLDDEADIYRDSTILPNLDSEFPSSGFNEPLAEEDDISFELQDISDASDVEDVTDDRHDEAVGDRGLLEDEPISLDLDDDEAFIDVPDEVLNRLVRPNGTDNGNAATSSPDDLHGDVENEADADEPSVLTRDDDGDRAALPDATVPQLEPSSSTPAALPDGTDDDPDEDAPRSRGLSAGPIFAAVAVVLVAWIAGILGYSIWQTSNAPDATSDPTAVTIPDNDSESDPDAGIPSEQPADGEPTDSANAYDRAVELSNRADGLMTNAQSRDDWTLAVTQWQQVIDLLQQVPQDDPNYEAAQTALSNAQQALAIAQEGVEQPIATNAPPTTTVRISGGEVCEGVRSTQESPPLELTNVQLDEPASPNSVTYFLGCITNHTDQVIDNVQISYTTGADAAPEQGSLNFRNLAPGQTIPFSSNFSLNPGTTEVTITNITWNASGTAEPQDLNTSLLVSQSAGS